MTKATLVRKMSKETGLDSKDVRAVLDSFIQTTISSVLQGDSVHLRGFGHFIRQHRARKVARNLSDNTALIVNAHYSPVFRPAKSFSEQLKRLKASEVA